MNSGRQVVGGDTFVFFCWSEILVDTPGCILLCTSRGLNILMLIRNICGHLDAFCSVLHMGWTFCCWSAIPVDTIGCILLCTSYSLDILLLICNTCGHLWMHSALYFTWVGHSAVDLQYLWTPSDAFCSVLHMGWTFCCWSAIPVDTFGCILLCTSHSLDILLLICNTYIDTFGCIRLCTSHGLDILLLICNTCGHPWMHSALYFTGVGHSVDFIDLHYKWIFLASFCV